MNGKDEEALKMHFKALMMGMRPNDFTFSTMIMICANITDYDQVKQVHILTIKYGFDSYDFVGIYKVGMSTKCGFVSSFVHSFWASCKNSHELTVKSQTMNVFNSTVVSFSLIMETFWSLKPGCSIENYFCLLIVVLRLLSGALQQLWNAGACLELYMHNCFE